MKGGRVATNTEHQYFGGVFGTEDGVYFLLLSSWRERMGIHSRPTPGFAFGLYTTVAVSGDILCTFVGISGSRSF